MTHNPLRPHSISAGGATVSLLRRLLFWLLETRKEYSARQKMVDDLYK